ncbi:phosphoribosylformylglycinamidine synthase subunit PurL [Rhabdothermincola sp.]|uniref:phosphoribosylformylglycinamidine synthase subunit PurL n=1 Tax=Rhabdothermincola sp. TaxID=2820405 RepID=UPI002FE31208
MAESIHRSLGLTDGEYDEIVRILGRAPNHLELAMYSVMWSEHCSYKSSRIHLKRLPTEGEAVLVGPGENAGVVDVGDGIAAALRIESHNHPSAIEPYQGAATGAGGILRDIFTMGARPIALMDPLRFGSLDDARSRWIAEGVVSGISGYGNSVGVPTVGGETVFDETYAENPLVNVLCLGLLPVDRLVLGQATGVGNLAVLLGATTGRDGIGGVSVLASAGFGDAESDEAKRPSVQVGDPFEEKRLIEACLELLDRGLVVGIQDLGGAGLTCATSETASRGGMGMDVDVRSVPLREEGMEPFEIMTSESQERMLAIVEPDHLDEVLEICRRWEVRASVVGKVTPGPATGDHDGGRLRILDGWDGEVLADIPAASLHEDAPLYDRPCTAPVSFDEHLRVRSAAPLPDCKDPAGDLLDLLTDTSWVWTQYDHQLFLNTVEGPGGDAVVLRLKHPRTGVDTGRGLALTTDGNHRWCAVDPRAGTALTVAESVMNLACVGARPVAVVNCLNFGNPEHPEVMWQFSEAVDGMAEACRVFGLPVIGGNVSFYNESSGADIDPTPVIGMLGLIDRLDRQPPGVGFVEGGRLLLVGVTQPELSGSAWARAKGHRGGHLPALDHSHHLAVAAVVRTLVAGGLLAGVHDVSSGGLGLALAEMAVRSGIGFQAARIADHRELFSESPSRAVLCVVPELVGTVENVCAEAGVPVQRIGVATGDRLSVKGLLDVGLEEATGAWRDRLPVALGSGTTQG